MRTRTIAWTLALCFLAAAVCFASPHMGTWKLNEAKSKVAPGTTKNHTVIYEAAGDDVKIIGKDYPVTGDPTSDARSYTVVDDNTLDFTIKKEGKVTITGQVVVSADGKTRSVTVNGMDAQGKKYSSTSVYDKL
jgi:hypothetical protein